jgi:hypothetical protein
MEKRHGQKASRSEREREIGQFIYGLPSQRLQEQAHLTPDLKGEGWSQNTRRKGHGTEPEQHAGPQLQH